MKAVIIRVGFDLNWGGIRGPIFDNGDFKFIPIPESEKDSEKVRNPTRYSDIPVLSEYIPNDKLIRNGKKIPIENCIVHDDPEFRTFTYGDLTRNIRGKVVKSLHPGDYIIFLAGLVPYKKDTYINKALNSIERNQSGLG